MLDALVNEAQIRWGLDLSAGLQLAAADWLVATPIEPRSATDSHRWRTLRTPGVSSALSATVCMAPVRGRRSCRVGGRGTRRRYEQSAARRRGGPWSWRPARA